MSNDKPHIHKLILAGVAGALAGSWWKSKQIEEDKKSRAEREDPDFVDEVRSKVNDLINELEVLEDMVDEDDFRDLLAEYLAKETDFEIEVAPDTPFGRPDILIEDTLVLELKYDPNKAEIDRCIGQCANYSREWVTWIVLYEIEDSKINYLSEVLVERGLDNIPIISFK